MKQNKIVVIHQPDFLPHLGFFSKLIDCDLFVILDHVQLLKRGWHHRDRIKNPQGEAVWLTVPVRGIKKFQRINEARIDYAQNWISKHLNMLREYYRSAEYFSEVFKRVENILNKKHKFLHDLNYEFIVSFKNYFSIEVEMLLSSDMNILSTKNQMNVDIVKKVKGNVYLSGVGARNYLKKEPFEQADIEIRWQEFEHPEYPQLHGKFIPNLSCLDFAMNCGPHLFEYLKK